MSDQPQPVNPLPWHTKPGLPAVYDANGDVVSFIRNADFLLWAANEAWRLQQQTPLIAAQK